MIKVLPHPPAWLSLGPAALPVKDAMRFLRDNLRRGSRRVREEAPLPFPPLPLMALAGDEMLDVAEGVLRGIAPGEDSATLLKAFPLPPGEYVDAGRLFIGTHYAVAKRLLREAAEGVAPGAHFISETAIGAAWHQLRPTLPRFGDDGIGQAAAITLALLRHRPIRRAPLAPSPSPDPGDLNPMVFCTAGLATAAAALPLARPPSGQELLGLARDVVRARIGSFEAAATGPAAHRELRRLFEGLAPILL